MNTVASSLHSSAKTAAKATTYASNTVKKVVVGDDKEYTWEELEAIEKTRRAILKRTEESFWG